MPPAAIVRARWSALAPFQVDHWADPELFSELVPENGYPSLYRTFLANVLREGMADRWPASRWITSATTPRRRISSAAFTESSGSGTIRSPAR
jgi:cell division inhibitor SulA